MKVLEFLDTIKDDKKKEIFKRRLLGHTINKIKKDLELNLSNERIRQIYLGIVREKKIELEEDKYIEVFKKYYFSKKDFTIAFKEEEITFNYLMINLKRGRLSFFELEGDISFPEEIRNSIKNIKKDREKENNINIEGELVFKSRRSIADYIVKTHFIEEGSIHYFEEAYNKFLKDNNLDNNRKFIMNARSYENVFLNGSNKVLWKQWRRFRYYDIASHDFTNFWEEINIKDYKDIEISTKKIWEINIELMKKYDIRDEYELHNLLRKLYTKEKRDGIYFGKMPIIAIGNADRNEQVLSLIKSLSPVKAIDFAKAYEEKYGVYANTVLGSFVRCVSSYFYNGIYDYEDQLTPSEEELKELRDTLTEDYYEIEDIKKIYKTKFKNSSEQNINAFSLTNLGFKVKEAYVIKDRFESASSYFRSILYPYDLVDTKKFTSALKNKSSYISALESLRSEYKILEIEEGKYSSIECQEKEGVTLNLIEDYVNAVAEHIKEDEFFSIKTLIDGGFTHKIHTLNKSERFYSSLIAERKDIFSYRTIGHIRIMRKGKHNIFIESLLEYILNNNLIEEEINTENITDLLKEKYGMLKASRHRISKFISSYEIRKG